MAEHPFNPQGSRLPLYLTLGGMITLGIVTTALGFLLWSEPSHGPDESTEGMFLDPAGEVGEAEPGAGPLPVGAAGRPPG